MAEEFVGTTQFGEFVKRIDERFSHVEKEFGHANQLVEQRHNEVNQRLADAEKAREQNLAHVVQRFDDLKGGIQDVKADIRQMRAWLIGLFGLLVSPHPTNRVHNSRLPCEARPAIRKLALRRLILPLADVSSPRRFVFVLSFVSLIPLVRYRLFALYPRLGTIPPQL